MFEFNYFIENGTVIINGCQYFDTTEITIPEFIEGYPVVKLDYATFYNRRDLVNINIPNSVTYIDCSVFRYCYSLTNINIPNSVIEMGSTAIMDTYNLTHINNIKLKLGVNIINNRFICICKEIFKITYQIGDEYNCDCINFMIGGQFDENFNYV